MAAPEAAANREVTVASPRMKLYLGGLNDEFHRAYAVARQARSKGKDPATDVEIAPAEDMAARVEGLVGPKGIAERIREHMKTKDREAAAFAVAKELMLEGGEITAQTLPSEKVRRIEQAVRTGLALVTEGVVSAPIEGISRVQVRKNPDGSEFISIGFAGPIRGAGGTGQAFALLLADFCRQVAHIGNYRPRQDEVERYVEELNLYARRTRAGQYVPTEEEIKHIANNCAVCIDGEPSEEYEVSTKKDLRVTVADDTGTKVEMVTNRVRSGVCLVMSEGVCLKAAKVLKITKKNGLDWQWVEKLIKVAKKDSMKMELKPSSKYMDEIVAGRPIFSYPMRPGGFRLRYGRTPMTGIAAKATHPATMVVLGEFPAIGTQLKVERPGKGCVITPCSDCEPPIVKLANGDVVRVNSAEEARVLAPVISEILFIGDLLVNYGDFLKSNHVLVPCGYNEEWHSLELAAKGIELTPAQARLQPAEEALELCRTKGVPLSPRLTFFWNDVSAQQMQELASWLDAAKYESSKGLLQASMAGPIEAKAKHCLEELGVPHRVTEGEIVIGRDEALALLVSMGMLAADGSKKGLERFNAAFDAQKTGLQIIVDAATVQVRDKSGTYIGASMGRPEKAKPRKMKPPVHALFPVGLHGGKLRSLVKAVKSIAEADVKTAELELNYRACPDCQKETWELLCESCGVHTVGANKCFKCGKLFVGELCSCGGEGSPAGKQPIYLERAFRSACERTNCKPVEVKGVVGLISDAKTAEPLEKGVLRAAHDVSVFRDGTIRFDATEIPLTHFTCNMAGITVGQARELGYEEDAFGKPLEDEGQWVELKPQDMILHEDAGEYLMRTARFVDDLLVTFYGMSAYYKPQTVRDMIGKHVVSLAPHTSAGVLSRVIGFNQVRAILAHPYMHCACRRNADGDELAIMLLLDALLNFSLAYLPASRGGKMDAPLVLSSEINPSQVDDEVHAMESVWGYPLEFYEAAAKFTPPGEVKVETIGQRLGTPGQFEGIGFTNTCEFEGAPYQSAYVRLGSMAEKLQIELELMSKIRAVDTAGAAERILLSHFFPDIYGNLRSFSKQSFRCVECNFKHRRVPLIGKCRKCGGKLLLTINRGGVEKYLKLSKAVAEKYGLPNYLKQRLMLLGKEIASIFENEQVKQVTLAEFV
jgi:DNA polymerase II large subunit